MLEYFELIFVGNRKFFPPVRLKGFHFSISLVEKGELY